MSRLTHDEYFLSLLKIVAARSTCPRRAVGAIIVDENHHILATGYNGPPRGFRHCIDHPCDGANDPSGDTRRCEAVHAEVNAMLQCAQIERAMTLYTSCAPCFECAKMICNTPIKRIVCFETYPGRGATMLTQAGVILDIANA